MESLQMVWIVELIDGERKYRGRDGVLSLTGADRVIVCVMVAGA